MEKSLNWNGQKPVAIKPTNTVLLFFQFFDMFVVDFAKPYLVYAQVKEEFLLLWSELDLCKAIVKLFHKIIVLK